MELPPEILASGRVLPDSDRAFLAMDVYRAGAVPRGVVRPETIAELREIVMAAAAGGLAIHMRGGGVSYTDGFLPRSADSIVIDTGALTRIVAINEPDMLVTVEPGISWQALDAALAPRGLKVPFVGTFSGLAASVGGTVSQNANGHGSNGAGISADSVVAIEALLPSGEFLRTSTAGAASTGALYRNYGPDLTGLLTGDAGTLGIKTAITLKLLRRKPAFAAASFAFPDFATLHACMARLAAEKIEDKSFGLDLALSQGQIAKQDAGSLLTVARSVWRSSNNTVSGLRSLIGMAAAGQRVLAAAPYAAHYIVDGHDPVEARAKLTSLRRIAYGFGREIANSVPTVVRAMPFQPLHNMLGPAGERWVPLHGLLPHSQVAAFHTALTAYVTAKRPEMAAKGVYIGAMFSCIGASTFLYEPALYWQDSLTEFHERMMDPAYLAQLPRYPANPPGAALVEEIRTHLITLMHAHGAAHFQIGKLYPYTQDRDPAALRLLHAVKADLDPRNLLNPGGLGL
jgi:D-lactate dehydrogenase (cytochrome)